VEVQTHVGLKERERESTILTTQCQA